MKKFITRVNSSLSLRRKVLLALISLMLIMAIGSGFVLYRFTHTVKTGRNVVEFHQPSSVRSLQLISEITAANVTLNNFVFSQDQRYETAFKAKQKSITNLLYEIITLASHPVHEGHNQQPEKTDDVIFKTDFMLHDFYQHADRIFYLARHPLENYPGLALASEHTDPHTLAYLGVLNELINSEHEDLDSNQRYQVSKLLNQLRYSWLQMNNAFRLFMTTRADNEMKNFYSYSAVNGQIHQQLLNLKFEIGFGALEELELHRNNRLEGVPKVVRAMQSKRWRQDVYILNEKISPLLVQLNHVLQTYSQDQLLSSEIDGDTLSSELTAARFSALLVLVISLLVAIIVAAIIFRAITPINQLTNIVKQSSLNNFVRIDDNLLARKDEVGGLASAFDKMTQDLQHDIRQRKAAEEKFESLLSSAPDAIIIVDQSGKINLFNHQAELLFGYTNMEVCGMELNMLIPERFHASHDALRQQYMQHPTYRPMNNENEIYALKKDGNEFPIEISLAPINTNEGLLISASIRDVTKFKEAQQQLVRQANYDALTNLPNRILAIDRLSHAIASSVRKHETIAVMFLDLDDFKKVNDTLGHSAGDKLLREVANRLSDCVRAHDTVARLGGDEFLVILPELHDLTDAETIAEKIIENISAPYFIDNRNLFIGVSIGITGYPEDGVDSDKLLKNADAAMYHAKEAGRNTFRFFTSKMNEHLLRRLEIESHLRYALEKDELELYFQPIIDMASGHAIAAEALLRWKCHKIGPIETEEFIQIAEETGLIGKIGEWVLHEACRCAKSWPVVNGKNIKVTINISAVQFRSHDIVKSVSDVLAQTGLPPDLIELEITERVLLEDNLNINRILRDLKRMGIRLSLDDFGTGYSSLSYLKRLPFDTIKIDRLFVSDITHDSENASLCKAIIAMAESLNLSVVAEGVETRDQFEAIKQLGAHYVQGYFHSVPVNNTKFEEYINSARLRVIK